MNLHANAALSLKGRRELCRAVVEREPANGWVGTAARGSPGCVIAPRRRIGARIGPVSSGSRRSRRCQRRGPSAGHAETPWPTRNEGAPEGAPSLLL
jgi:hypothetical protein